MRTELDVNGIIKNFFESVKLEKVKGILVKDTCDGNTFYAGSKEEFFKDNCEEEEVYICDNFLNDDYPYKELDLVQELLEDDFEEYLKTLNITDEDYDELLDYYNQEDLEYLIEEVTNK